MANNLIKLIIAGTQVVGRAFARAVRQEIEQSQRAAQRSGGGKQGAKRAAADTYTGMSLQEAKEILNISDISDKEALEKSYQHLFDVNDKKKGGSFYIQSKVYRAKERIDMEFEQMAKTQSTSSTQTTQQSTQS